MDLRAIGQWIAAHAGRRFGERGANLVEYILVVFLIAIVAMVAVAFFGAQTSTKYSTTGQGLFPEG
jgi:Flp pilus assembly pilin Flp